MQVLAGGGTLADLRGLGEQDIETIYSIGFNFYNQAKYAQAEPMFQFACVYSHLERRYWMALGNCRQMAKNYQGAIDAYGFAFMLDAERSLAGHPDGGLLSRAGQQGAGGRFVDPGRAGDPQRRRQRDRAAAHPGAAPRALDYFRREARKAMVDPIITPRPIGTQTLDDLGGGPTRTEGKGPLGTDTTPPPVAPGGGPGSGPPPLDPPRLLRGDDMGGRYQQILDKLSGGEVDVSVLDAEDPGVAVADR